jgi:hypothetical protein
MDGNTRNANVTNCTFPSQTLHHNFTTVRRNVTVCRSPHPSLDWIKIGAGARYRPRRRAQCSHIIGSGIMSIPAILKVLGVFPAIALILIVAVLAEVSVDFLMRFTDAGVKTTYASVMREAFGSVGGLTTKVIVIINNFGGLILLLIIIG